MSQDPKISDFLNGKPTIQAVEPSALYSLDKKQVALGVFLSFLLVFSIGTVIAWNRYNPIIQEFIIKENIEKARKKSSEKNKRRMKKFDKFKKFFNKARTEVHFRNSGEGVRLSSGEGSSDAPVDRQAAADRAAQAAERRMKPDPTPQNASKRRIQMIAKRERELEEERRKMETLNVSNTPKPKDEEPKELDHSSAISSIRPALRGFHPLLGSRRLRIHSSRRHRTVRGVFFSGK
ncbi:unnamed protein product [Caenorhabditis brenneri]